VAWTYFCIICSFISELSKVCVDISVVAHQYNTTEITGNSSVNPASHTQIVIASQIRILLEQTDNFEILCEEITRDIQKLTMVQFVKYFLDLVYGFCVL